jgi:hypothetical protein
MVNANNVFEVVPGKNDREEHVFTVVVKRTYQIKHGSPLERSEQDHELRKIDAYYDDGDPQWSTVQYEYELAAYKYAVDVVVVGKAYAQGGDPVQSMMTSVQVGDRQKSIAVFGDRQCHFRTDAPPVFSEPKPFVEMEIRYDRAYGGYDEKSNPDTPLYYPRNTMGVGVALRNTKEVVQGLALPNLEDPNDLLTPERITIEDPKNWPNQPLPQGFGWYQRTWYPRCALLGAYPAYIDVGTVTAEESMGLLPSNHIALAKQFKLPTFLARFNNGASIGMLFNRLADDELISLRGLTPDGLLEFNLPGESPDIMLDIGRGEKQLYARLDTVSIRPDDLEVDLIWRGAYVYEGYSWWPKMQRLYAEVH